MTGDRVADPAIHAAMSAMLTVTEPTVHATAVAAAREALAPLRELHRPAYLNDNPYSDAMHDCGECETDWPCATARLVYREDEL